MPQLLAGFELNSRQPNFTRDVFDTKAAMKNVNPKHIDEGHFSYCKEDQMYYTFVYNGPGAVYDESTGWWQIYSRFGVWYGSTPPPDNNMLWVQNNPSESKNEENSDAISTLQAQVSTLQAQVKDLMYLINYGVIAGDASIGGRTQIRQQSDYYTNPNTGEEEDGEFIEPNKIKCTVPNLAIKVDTLTNFKQHVQNLINGELLWIQSENETDTDPGLYIYLYKTGFTPIGSGSGGGVIDPGDPTSVVYRVIEGQLAASGSGISVIDGILTIKGGSAVIDENGVLQLTSSGSGGGGGTVTKDINASVDPETGAVITGSGVTITEDGILTFNTSAISVTNDVIII